MKPKARIKECNGQAHKPNVDQDNCMVCMPRWGTLVLCPEHGRGLPLSGYCIKCKKYYNTEEEPIGSWEDEGGAV